MAKRSVNTVTSRKRAKNGSTPTLLPFWNSNMQEISRYLPLPDITNNISKEILLNSKCPGKHRTWFSARNVDTLQTKSRYTINSTYIESHWPHSTGESIAEPLPSIEIGNNVLIPPKTKLEPHFRCVKIKMFLRNDCDRETLRRYYGIYRWTYNQSVQILNDREVRESRNSIVDPALTLIWVIWQKRTKYAFNAKDTHGPEGQ